MMIKGDGIPPLKLADSVLYVSTNRNGVVAESVCPIQFNETSAEELSLLSYSPILEADIPFESELIAKTAHLKIVLLNSNQRGYDSAVIGREMIRKGGSSKWLEMEFKVKREQVSALPEDIGKAGFVTGLFRFQLREMSADASDFELLRTPVFITRAWTYPESLGEEILRNVEILKHVKRGHETPYSLLFPSERDLDKLGSEALSGKQSQYLNEARDQADRLCQIIKYLESKHEWDLCFFHYHLVDSVNHRFLGYLSPYHLAYAEDRFEEAMGEYEAAYGIIDKLVGTILKECVDDDTLVVFVSDHAALPCWKIVRIYQAFVRSDLLAYKWDRERKKYVVILSGTKAFPWLEPTYVWVNLKGRDPGGIVEPEDYDSIRERSIEALVSIRDPDTGKCPISLALGREQAHIMGQFGDRVGDVVYALEPGYQVWDMTIEDEWSHEIFPDVFEGREISRSFCVTGNHDQHLPLAKIGVLSNTPVLIMAGPGVRKNHYLTRPARLTDLAPTIAQILGIPAPAQADGKILWEALELNGN